jgi:hypothetical protein
MATPIVSAPMMIAYGTTGSGDAGNESSRQRRILEDLTGLTGKRQREIFTRVVQSGYAGMTVGEVEDRLRLGHGQASSALTHLHRAQHLIRIKDQRMKQEIYLHPDYRGDREESPYRPRREHHHPKFLTREQLLAVMMDANVDESFYDDVRAVIENLP